MQDVIEKTLNDMRAQEQAIQQQISNLQNQLLMTQGAVQVLEHILNQAEPAETSMEVNEHAKIG